MKDIIERLERMKLGAQANIDIGNIYYIAHAECARDLANDVLNLLTKEKDFGKFKQVLFSKDEIELLKKVLPKPAIIPGLNGTDLRDYREILTRITGENYRFPDTDEKCVVEQKSHMPQWRKQDLPYGCLWHVLRSKSKNGKTVYRTRRITWESYIIGVTIYGDDGLYFLSERDAEVAARNLRAKEKEGNGNGN